MTKENRRRRRYPCARSPRRFRDRAAGSHGRRSGRRSGRRRWPARSRPSRRVRARLLRRRPSPRSLPPKDGWSPRAWSDPRPRARRGRRARRSERGKLRAHDVGPLERGGFTAFEHDVEAVAQGPLRPRRFQVEGGDHAPAGLLVAGPIGRSGRAPRGSPGKYIWVMSLLLNASPKSERWMWAGRQALSWFFHGYAPGLIVTKR